MQSLWRRRSLSKTLEKVGNPSLSSIGQKSRSHRKSRCCKARRERRRMVVGDDVGVGDISRMLSKIVLDHFLWENCLPPKVDDQRLVGKVGSILNYVLNFETVLSTSDFLVT
jgi:hypothetical protein